MILVKGMLKRDLKDIIEAEFNKAIGLIIIKKIKFQILIIERVIRVTALVIITSKKKVKKACDKGVV